AVRKEIDDVLRAHHSGPCATASTPVAISTRGSKVEVDHLAHDQLAEHHPCEAAAKHDRPAIRREQRHDVIRLEDIKSKTNDKGQAADDSGGNFRLRRN